MCRAPSRCGEGATEPGRTGLTRLGAPVPELGVQVGVVPPVDDGHDLDVRVQRAVLFKPLLYERADLPAAATLAGGSTKVILHLGSS